MIMSSTISRAALLTALIASAATAQRDTLFSWSKKLPDGARFSIRNLNGAIEVQPGSTDQIEVRATIRTDARGLARDLKFEVREQAPDSVEICTTERGDNACEPEDLLSDNHTSVQYVVALPKGLRLRVATRNGNVIVMQTVNEVEATTTGNGDVVIRESLSRAIASSSSGDVTVAMANGQVRATSGNGRVTVNTARGPVTASSGNGDVDVRMFSLAPPPALGQVQMSITSGNGDVRLTLPADFNGEIDASSGHGGTKSDFDLKRSSDDRSRLRGTIGNGKGPLIRLTTGNGKLEIRKG
jgi:hypothetical protein